MLDTLKALIANQFEAALCTINDCVLLCPDSSWNAPVVNNPYSQTVFHVLLFTDFYLCPEEHSLRQQPYHRQHADFFGDYEQLEDRKPVCVYEKPAILDYLEFCRGKARDTVAAESAETLAGPSGFSFRPCSRAGLHVYNMRHLIHHAAQLSMRLRIDAGIEVPWTGHAWRE